MVVLQGVLFGRSIRSYHFILHLAAQHNDNDNDNDNDDDDKKHVVIRIQMEGTEEPNGGGAVVELRSWCRRMCKFGHLLRLEGTWTERKDTVGTDWTQQRFVVRVASLADAQRLVRVVTPQEWNMVLCQQWQRRYLPQINAKQRQEEKKAQRAEQESSTTTTIAKFRHGGGIGKRQQADLLACFLVRVMMETVSRQDFTGSCVENWVSSPVRNKAIRVLNGGTGVVDAAGGSGHVSMALGMAGIQSTVVDPRESVGKLPGRDRKVWNRARKGSEAVVPYDTVRAWFAHCPEGVDASFRHPDETTVPVCGTKDRLVQNCSAIVALHPDEATEAIVDVAVQQRIPFVVVPCCVFARLFPHRRMPNHNKNVPVSTYEDFLVYLMNKDPMIRKTTLPFEGANNALWATFR